MHGGRAQHDPLALTGWRVVLSFTLPGYAAYRESGNIGGTRSLVVAASQAVFSKPGIMLSQLLADRRHGPLEKVVMRLSHFVEARR